MTAPRQVPLLIKTDASFLSAAEPDTNALVAMLSATSPTTYFGDSGGFQHRPMAIHSDPLAAAGSMNNSHLAAPHFNMVYPNQNHMMMAMSPTSPTRFQATGGSPFLAPQRKRTNYTVNETAPLFDASRQLADIYSSRDPSKKIYAMVSGRFDKGLFLTQENEWACYRRNYFQVSAAFQCVVEGAATHPAPGDHVLLWNGQAKRVLGYKVGLRGRVPTTEKEVEIHQHTSKRSKGPISVAEPKLILPGGDLVVSGQPQPQQQQHQFPGMYMQERHLVATFERLQFKSSNNNGTVMTGAGKLANKAKPAQQYYVVDVVLYAVVDGLPHMVMVSTATSVPIAVRSRSPAHYSGPAPAAGAIGYGMDRLSPYPPLSPGSLSAPEMISPRPVATSMIPLSPQQIGNGIMADKLLQFQQHTMRHGPMSAYAGPSMSATWDALLSPGSGAAFPPSSTFAEHTMSNVNTVQAMVQQQQQQQRQQKKQQEQPKNGNTFSLPAPKQPNSMDFVMAPTGATPQLANLMDMSELIASPFLKGIDV